MYTLNMIYNMRISIDDSEEKGALQARSVSRRWTGIFGCPSSLQRATLFWFLVGMCYVGIINKVLLLAFSHGSRDRVYKSKARWRAATNSIAARFFTREQLLQRLFARSYIHRTVCSISWVFYSKALNFLFFAFLVFWLV